MPETIRVTYHHEPSAWWAESDDLQGFSAAGATLQEVRELVRDGIALALGVSDVDLLESDSQGNRVFVVDVQLQPVDAVNLRPSTVERSVENITVGVAETPDFRFSWLAAI